MGLDPEDVLVTVIGKAVFPDRWQKLQRHPSEAEPSPMIPTEEGGDVAMGAAEDPLDDLFKEVALKLAAARREIDEQRRQQIGATVHTHAGEDVKQDKWAPSQEKEDPFSHVF